MLKLLRQRGLQRKIFIGLAIVIIPSFLFFGVMLNDDGGKTAGPLAKVGNRTLTVTDYLNSYRAVQHQLQFVFGEKWNEMRRFVNLKGEAWDRILLLQEAKRRGIHTSDREVVDWIAGQQAFQRQGKYYPEIYRMAVRDYLRMEPRDFEEEIRGTLTIEKLSKKISDSVKVDDAEVRKAFDEERAKKNEAHDDAAFEKDKAVFREQVVSGKMQDAMRDLLEKLRGGLQLNMEKMREIFPEEPETPEPAVSPAPTESAQPPATGPEPAVFSAPEAAPTPASGEYPSVPS